MVIAIFIKVIRCISSAGTFPKPKSGYSSVPVKSDKNATIVITHYQRLLDYIAPDFVHVLYKGRIVKSGGPELALELEEKGYDWIKKEVDA